MKITRYNRGYHISVSNHEMQILRVMESILSRTPFKSVLTTGQRRSYARRTYDGSLLRTDVDKRTDEFKDMERTNHD